MVAVLPSGKAECWCSDEGKKWYSICWCDKRHKANANTYRHNSFVLVSWWCRAYLLPRSLFHCTSAKMKPFLGSEWWAGELMTELVDQCLLIVFTSNVKQMLNACIHEKRVRDKVYNTITESRLWTLLRYIRKTMGALSFKRLRTDLCGLFILESLAASAAFSVNTFLVNWIMGQCSHDVSAELHAPDA